MLLRALSTLLTMWSTPKLEKALSSIVALKGLQLPRLFGKNTLYYSIIYSHRYTHEPPQKLLPLLLLSFQYTLCLSSNTNVVREGNSDEMSWEKKGIIKDERVFYTRRFSVRRCIALSFFLVISLSSNSIRQNETSYLNGCWKINTHTSIPIWEEPMQPIFHVIYMNLSSSYIRISISVSSSHRLNQ